MKIIVIGDIHGRKVWKQINPDNYDKIVFVGDYTDTRDRAIITAEDIYHNLLDIIEFKKKYPEKVVLLIGNHDLMYFFIEDRFYACSGFMYEYSEHQHQTFNLNWSLFQPSWQIGKILITHAGVSNAWYTKYKAAIETFQQAHGLTEISETLNAMWEVGSMRKILAVVGEIREGYRGDKGGIFWADRRETREDSLTGYHQIVGHTPIDPITRFGDPDSDTTIRYVDVLAFRTEFYEFEYVD